MAGRRRNRVWVAAGAVAVAALATVAAQEWERRSRRAPLYLAGPIPPEVQAEWDRQARAAAEELRKGRLARAETILAGIPVATGQARRERAAARSLYEQLLALEGRRHEYRSLLADDVETLADPVPAIRDLWRDDAGPYPFERTRAALESLAAQAPEERRLWLARGNLALRAGRLDEARHWIDRCLSDHPSYHDAPIRRAAAELGVALDDEARVVSALKGSPSGLGTFSESLARDAWFAARRGDRGAEQSTLEHLLKLDPGYVPALERLAELSAAAGRADAAAAWRARKAEIDRAREPYRRLVESPDASDPARAAEAARLAETLGRRTEARGWWRVVLAARPGDAAAVAALERLHDPSTPGDLHAPRFDWTEPAAGDRKTQARAPDDPGPAPAFTDDAATSGLVFTYQSGKSVAHQLPETMGGGVGLLDYDGDGRLDVYLVQGGTFPPDPKSPPRGDRLFRNRGDGTFEDVTKKSGIDRLPQGYGHGVTVGDVDNDGRPDLFVTRWRSYALYRNAGDGTFVDVTSSWGLGGDRDWPTSAAFADLDGDGDLDLYVCHYLAWDAADPRLCRNPETSAYTYCAPLLLAARPDHLFRNDGGKFTDVSGEAGVTAADTDGRGLGVVAADLDGDHRLDLYVANDASANFLFLNRGGLKFEEVGHAAGVAGNAEGGYQGSMGVACSDLDGDGKPDLAVTNLYGESTTLYANLGAGAFADRTAASGFGAATRELLGFGAVFLDVNADGRTDFASANGHVNDFRPTYPYAMRAQLLAGASRPGGPARFVDVTSKAGAAWTEPRAGRALAAGDLDNDGRVDLVLVPLDGPVAYLHNRTEGGHTLTLRLEGAGPGSNRDAVGAVVTVSAGGRSQTIGRFGGGSYQSASDPRVHVGLGDARAADEVQVRWPSGRVTTYRGLAVDAGYRLREGVETADPLPGFRPGVGPR